MLELTFPPYIWFDTDYNGASHRVDIACCSACDWRGPNRRDWMKSREDAEAHVKGHYTVTIFDKYSGIELGIEHVRVARLKYWKATVESEASLAYRRRTRDWKSSIRMEISVDTVVSSK